MNYLRRLLGEDESVVLAAHKHWTAFLGWVWHWGLLFILGFALAIFLNLLPGYNLSLREAMGRLTAPQQWALRIALFALLVFYPAAKLVVRYMQWRAEEYVVTNLRVIQLSGILSKRVLDSSLEKVNDVLLEQSLMGRILGYGNVEILTASELAVNKFHRVAQPLTFKTAMLNAKQDLEGASRERPEDPAKLIADLARLREQGILSEDEFQAKKTKVLDEI